MGSVVINNVGKMEESVANIASYNQKLSNDMASIEYIITQINANWISEEADKLSEINNLQALKDEFTNNVLPVLEKVVTTMNELIADTVATSNNSGN